MARLDLINVCKVYKGNVNAVTNFNMSINDGEFIVFVGPSGCGKSTTLRMIAGLEDITSGEIYIDGQYVNDIEPKDRDLAMVFQNYALYPYLTVYENIAFGLRLRKIKVPVLDKDGNQVYVVDRQKIKELKKEINNLKSLKGKDLTENLKIESQISKLNDQILQLKNKPSVPRYRNRKLNNEEIDEKVRHVASMLDIEQYLTRKPGALSGGQRQRVALGRAIVRDARVYLFDEPLSNLDAKLRAAMRVEIINLHQKLNTTFIYVTHDQVEAMTMGTRIVVMKDGFVQQIDTPTNLYDKPQNKFVAGFIGTPQMNFFPVMIKQQDEEYYASFSSNLTLKIGKIDIISDFKQKESFQAILGIRSEDIHIAKKGEESFKATVKIVEILGHECLIYLQLNDSDLKSEFVMKLQTRCLYVQGDIISIAFNKEHLHLFDNNTEKSVLIKK